MKLWRNRRTIIFNLRRWYFYKTIEVAGPGGATPRAGIRFRLEFR